MRFIFVCREYPPSARLGGIGYYIHDIATLAASMGHEVHVVCAADDRKASPPVVENGVTLHRLGEADYYAPQRKTLKTRVANKWFEFAHFDSYRKKLAVYLDKVCSKVHPDIVEFADFGAEALHWKCTNASTVLSVRVHGPTIIDMRSGGLRTDHWRAVTLARGKTELSVLRNADLITAPSTAMTKWIHAHAGKNLKVELIPNFVDFRYWSALPRRAAADSAIPMILYAGAVVETKGCAELIAACKALRDSGVQLELILAGRHGHFADRIKSGALTGGSLPEWIKLPGALTRAELREQYAAASLCVFPSWWESFGLVCAEAMATGALVIGSRAGGMSDIIEDGANGWLVAPRDPLSLTDKIRHVLELPEQTKRKVRERAQASVEERFSAEAVTASLFEAYARALSTKTGAHATAA